MERCGNRSWQQPSSPKSGQGFRVLASAASDCSAAFREARLRLWYYAPPRRRRKEEEGVRGCRCVRTLFGHCRRELKIRFREELMGNRSILIKSKTVRRQPNSAVRLGLRHCQYQCLFQNTLLAQDFAVHCHAHRATLQANISQCLDNISLLPLNIVSQQPRQPTTTLPKP